MKKLELTYRGDKRGLVGYVDADGASQEHRCAISGYIFMIDGGAISWSSKKQELVTLSTMEAKYVAQTHTAKEVIWFQQLLTELFGSINTPTTLFSNSKSAIALAQDSHYHACTKYIDIHYHFICYVINAGTIKLIYCSTDNMTADRLTKVLPSVKAKHFAKALGLCTVWGGVLKYKPYVLYFTMIIDFHPFVIIEIWMCIYFYLLFCHFCDVTKKLVTCFPQGLSIVRCPLNRRHL